MAYDIFMQDEQPEEGLPSPEQPMEGDESDGGDNGGMDDSAT